MMLGMLHGSACLRPPVPELGWPLRRDPQIARSSHQLCLSLEAAADSLELVASIPNGVTERLQVRSEEEVADAAIEIAARHSLDSDAALEVEMSLWTQWFNAVEAEMPPQYEGQTPAGGELEGVVASFDLEESGLVIEVARSLVAADAGLGLFIRCMDSVGEVPLNVGTAICGYAAGEMRHEPDETGGKTVAFALSSLDTSVFFERELHSVRALLEMESVDAIAGHVLRRDAEGTPSSLDIDPEYDGERYFVPDAAQPEPPTMLTVGCRANDLALGKGGAGDYDRASEEKNLLVLVQRLERSSKQPGLLVPSRPISTLARSVTIRNTVPMELGCRYGGQFWQSFWEDDKAEEAA